MIIDGSEAGGGLLRAALPLSISQQISLEIVNFRSGRREPGLGWPHLAVLRALETGGIIELEGAEMGSTAMSIVPAERIVEGSHVDVNLDDPDFTFLSSDIRTERDYHSVEDAFPAQELINRGGRGVRGHAVSTPLLGLLPLTLAGVKLSLSGGTETPGAPFVDALRSSTLRVVNSLFDLQMGVNVHSRGAFGVGGGRVSAGVGQNFISSELEKPSFTTYWSNRTANSGSIRAVASTKNIDRIRTMLPDVILRNELYDDTCPAINQLLILPQTSDSFARDISLCAEEAIEQISDDALVTRVVNEQAHNGVVSRFHIEQVLLFSTILGRSGVWRTERITPHIQAVMRLIEITTDAELIVEEFAEYTKIKIA